MSQYTEICITPNALREVFISEIMGFTHEAIEESGESVIVRMRDDKSRALVAFLQSLSKNLSEINATPIRFTHTIAHKPDKDYIKAYKDSVSAIDCGIFHIYPPWLAPKTSKINIILEPSLAFGTGHHASTFMCLMALQQRDFTRFTSLLDVGCGSGILALCAHKLGAKVSLCDIDELAIAESTKNFAQNGALIEQIWLGKASENPQEYNIVIANLTASILIEESHALIASVANGGHLIISGILDIHAKRVKDAFRGLKPIAQDTQDEWVCLTYFKGA